MGIEPYDVDRDFVAGEPLLELPGFWPVYLGRGDTAWSGCDAADMSAADEALMDVDAWPAFRIPLADDHQILVLHYNVAGDYGVDYRAHHPDWRGLMCLADPDGQTGWGLTWPELLHIADGFVPEKPEDKDGVRGSHARLLLLLPILSDADLPRAEALTRVAAALIACGAEVGVAQSIATWILDSARFHDEAPTGRADLSDEEHFRFATALGGSGAELPAAAQQAASPLSVTVAFGTA